MPASSRSVCSTCRIRSRASLAEQLLEPGEIRVAGRRRPLVRDLAPGPGECQPLDEQQVLEPQHPLDVRAPVHPRTTRRLRDPEVRKLRFPRTQHVRLDPRNLADLRRTKQRTIGNLGAVQFGHQRRWPQYSRHFRSSGSASGTGDPGGARARRSVVGTWRFAAGFGVRSSALGASQPGSGGRHLPLRSRRSGLGTGRASPAGGRRSAPGPAASHGNPAPGTRMPPRPPPPDLDPDGRAEQAERLPQPVDQEPLVGKVELGRDVREEHERRRRDAGLGGVKDPHLPPARAGRAGGRR